MPVRRSSTRPTLALNNCTMQRAEQKCDGDIPSAKKGEEEIRRKSCSGKGSAKMVLECSFEGMLGPGGIELQMATVRCCLSLCLGPTTIGTTTQHI